MTLERATDIYVLVLIGTAVCLVVKAWAMWKFSNRVERELEKEQREIEMLKFRLEDEL